MAVMWVLGGLLSGHSTLGDRQLLPRVRASRRRDGDGSADHEYLLLKVQRAAATRRFHQAA